MNGIGKLDDIRLLQPFLEMKNRVLNDYKEIGVIPIERVNYILDYISGHVDLEFILQFIGKVTGTELHAYYNDTLGELLYIGVIPLMEPMFPGMFWEAM
jgi:hypothetical protein